MGVESLETICDAYAELLSRETALKTLITEVDARIETVACVTTEEEINNDIVAMIVLYQDEFQNELSLEEMERVAQISSLIEIGNVDVVRMDESLYPASTGITTPNGSSVAYETRTCSHSNADYHSALDAQTVKAYGVTLISGGTCKYNCHSYAWYSQSTSNSYWINNPSVYMTDGSYSRVMSGTTSSSGLAAANGDRVYYASNTHSAILSSSATGEPIATRTVKSKWGSLGVFSHTVSNVPSSYDTSSVSCWHR